MNATILIRGLSYTYLPGREDVRVLLAVLTNYPILVVCCFRYGISWYLSAKLLVVLLVTVSAYHYDADLVGTSSLWNFWYGNASNTTSLDHVFFVFSNVCVVIFCRTALWPWSVAYMYKCIAAHLAAACAGWISSQVDAYVFASSSEIEHTGPQVSRWYDAWALNQRCARRLKRRL